MKLSLIYPKKAKKSVDSDYNLLNSEKNKNAPEIKSLQKIASNIDKSQLKKIQTVRLDDNKSKAILYKPNPELFNDFRFYYKPNYIVHKKIDGFDPEIGKIKFEELLFIVSEALTKTIENLLYKDAYIPEYLYTIYKIDKGAE